MPTAQPRRFAAFGLPTRRLIQRSGLLPWLAYWRRLTAPIWVYVWHDIRYLLAAIWPAEWRYRAITIAVGTLAVVTMAYSILWAITAGMLETRFRETVRDYANAHVAISHGEIRRFGYPGALRLEVLDPTYAYKWVRSDGSHATLTWSDARMEVRASPFRPSVLQFDSPKKAVIEATSPDGTAAPTVRLQAETARVDVLLGDGRAMPIMAELSHVMAVEGADGSETQLLERFDFTGDYGNGTDEPSADWRFKATGLSGVDLENGKLQASDALDQGRIDRVSGTINVFGPLPEPSSNGSMRAWRDAEGRVDIREGRLETPKLDAAFAGTFALDDQMRPVSRIDTTINGLGKAVEGGQFGSLGEKGEGESLLVVLLGLLSGQEDPNGPVELKFETSDGRAYLGSVLGSIRIGKVGPIDFEAADGPLVPFSFRFKE